MIFQWTFDPVAFQLGPLSVRWYGVLFVGAFLLGDAVMRRIFISEGRDPSQAERLLIIALISAIVGARLAHCIFYDPAYFSAHPLDIFKVWEGGLASHGGAVGLVLGLAWGARRAVPKIPFLWLLDRTTIPAAIAAVFIRVANFLNSEIVGLPTDGRWGVVFTSVDPLPRHPVQLYEAAVYAAIAAVLVTIYRRVPFKPRPGLMLGVFFTTAFSARIVIEFFKTPQAAYEAGKLFTVGQWLSVPFVLIGIALLAWRLARDRRAPDA